MKLFNGLTKIILHFQIHLKLSKTLILKQITFITRIEIPPKYRARYLEKKHRYNQDLDLGYILLNDHSLETTIEIKSDENLLQVQ